MPGNQPLTGQPTRAGTMIVVVGPGGSGKDSIMRAAKPTLESGKHAHFVKRVITRECKPERENHHSVSPGQFRQMAERGDFAVYWQAHSLWYGVPINTLSQIKRGHTLIVNGSRDALPDFRSTYPHCQAVWINVSKKIQMERLKARHVKPSAEMHSRLQRTVTQSPDPQDFILNNDGTLADSTDEFISLVIGTIAKAQQ
ncbi:MAG: phosphonate metabolism protein/1,5-bisphosphokinase (PRPP-forming) PhnN [Pseudomonadota bacterium]